MKAVFLDCNGVISEERPDYIKNPDEFIFLPGSIDAIKLINALGLPVIIVSNQSGVARGRISMRNLKAIHAKMISSIVSEGGAITKTYYCIHYPDCEYRKPRIGMLMKASKDLGIGLSDSFFIGDKTSDMKAANAAGCTAILVTTGHGTEQRQSAEHLADFIDTDILAAARRIAAMSPAQSSNVTSSKDCIVV